MYSTWDETLSNIDAAHAEKRYVQQIAVGTYACVSELGFLVAAPWPLL
jgi:hypothetical protein